MQEQQRARVGTSAAPSAHNNNAALLVNRAVADNRGLLPAARLFTIYFENVLLLCQEAPHLKAVDVWEMGRNKMGGAIVGITWRLMRRRHLKLSLLH